ncbi:unnamed protein product [Eruca vesicaria subsp. sativa]|uniref:Uncharacterized protein n=1 Tax=Eruca vesicaria subsp. sativa TaxID=29727 RepID=A0ABC8JVD2_ERUVS|nr:unnamed protein product [Eruca vesicaria subsp. sativa]
MKNLSFSDEIEPKSVSTEISIFFFFASMVVFAQPAKQSSNQTTSSKVMSQIGLKEIEIGAVLFGVSQNSKT